MTTNRPTSSEEAAKREGYLKGRNDESYVQNTVRNQARAVRNVREKDSYATGMILGLIIAAFAAIVGGFFFLANGDTPDAVPVAVPEIEKDITADVELPDVEVNVPEVEVPDVNITEGASEDAAE